MISRLSICLLLGTALACGAQEAGPRAQTGNPALDNKHNALVNSLALFASQNYAGGAALLQAANLTATGTAEWSMESASAFLAAANYFRSRGNATTEMGVVQLAVNQLTAAAGLFGQSTPAAERAMEQELLGYIAERFYGNYSAARGYYTAAVALSPRTGQAPVLLATLLKRYGPAL